MDKTTLWYFADPMCSWCWGFTTVLEEIGDAFGNRLAVRLVMGGLRPGTKEPMTRTMRDEILHHWHEVQRWTGQVFSYEGAMPDGFVYNTEPPSRAVVAAGLIQSEAGRPFFHSIQAAFYMTNRDVTKTEELVHLAEQAGFKADTFRDVFESDQARSATLSQFRHAREWAVSSFPTVVMQKGGELKLLTRGYQAFDDLRPALEQWLKGT
jgi:putative protein-disulfide isomerase